MQNFSAKTIQSKKTAQKLSRVGICKQVIGADEKIKLLFITSKRVNETFLYQLCIPNMYGVYCGPLRP